MSFAEFYLTDGETRIDLFGATRGAAGFAVTETVMARATRIPGPRLGVSYETVDEVHRVTLTALTQNQAATYQQDLDRLLEQARRYFDPTIGNESALVWLVSRASEETNPRYAVIYGGQLNDYGDIFGTGFFTLSGRATLPELELALTRSPWLANPPRNPTCIPCANRYPWQFRGEAWQNIFIASAGGANAIYTTNSGVMVFGGDAIYRSSDDGDTWSLITTPGNGTKVWDFIDHGGRLYAAVGKKNDSAVTEAGIYYSDNNGTSWTQQLSGVNVFKFAGRRNGELFAGATNTIYELLSGTWTDTNLTIVGDVTAMLVTRAQTLLVAGTYNVFRQLSGESFVVVSTVDSAGPFTAMAESAVIILASSFDVSVSWDDGLSFELSRSLFGASSLYALSNGDVLLGAAGDENVYISKDGGLTWSLSSDGFTSPIGGFAVNAVRQIFTVDASNIWRRASIESNFIIGATDDGCDSLIYVANKRTVANITIAKLFDNSTGTYTTYRADQLGGVAILPQTPFADDALYIGVQSNIDNAGPFTNLVFELDEGNQTLSVTPEYYDFDTGWTAFQYLTDTTYSLRRSGIVSWEGVNIAKLTVDGVNAYWVRFRVTDPGSQGIVPIATNIYSVTQPYVEFDPLPGDIPTLMLAELIPQTKGEMDTFNGNGGMIIGARSTARGERFAAFINLAETQNPQGIAVVGSFVDDLTASAVGQHVRHTQSTVDDWDTAVSISIETGIAAEFAGVFQLYVRYKFAGDFSAMQLRGNVNRQTGEPVYLTPATSLRLQHLGTFHIADNQIFEQELAVPLYINVEAKSSAEPVRNAVDMMEIILLPADEWIGEFVGQGANNETTIIDSATFPRRTLRAYTRQNGTRYVVNPWRSSASGPFALDRGKTTRLWIIQQSYANGELSAPFAAVQRVKLYGHSRWLGLRGAE